MGRFVFGESTPITHLLIDCALMMNLSSPFVVRATFQSWLLCVTGRRGFAALGYSAADCSWCTSGGDTLHCGRAAADRRCCRYVLLVLVASTISVTWSTYLPTCGMPPSATSRFLAAKLSATSPLWKLAMSQWRGLSRVYAWASLSAQDEVVAAAHAPSGGPGFGGHQAEEEVPAPPPFGPSQPSRDSSCRSSWTRRWTLSSRGGCSFFDNSRFARDVSPCESSPSCSFSGARVVRLFVHYGYCRSRVRSRGASCF